MEWVELTARERSLFGKEACKKLRDRNEMPGILYGGEEGNISVVLNPVELRKAIEEGGGENVIIRLTIRRDGDEMVRTVMVKDLQFHPVNGRPLHVDLLRISMEKLIRVKVPITLQGEAPGVKVDGGILEHILREAEVECLPASIPEALIADISSLKIGDGIHVKDLHAVEGVKILEGLETLVASVVPPEKEEEVVAAPEVVPAEPEVLTKKEPKEEKEREREKEREKEKDKEKEKVS